MSTAEKLAAAVELLEQAADYTSGPQWSPSMTGEITAFVAAYRAKPADEASIVDPSRSAKDMRRFAALWRYGSQVLPGASATTRAFDSWLFQLDMLIDSKTHGLPFDECPSIAQPSADGAQRVDRMSEEQELLDDGDAR